MSVCAICRQLLRDAQTLLSCGHAHCSDCFARAQNAALELNDTDHVICQWKGCGRAIPRGECETLEFFSSVGGATGVDDLDYDPEDKAMDEELMELARQMGHLKAADDNKMAGNETKRMRIEQVLKDDGSENEAMDKEEEDPALTLMLRLNHVVRQCKDIRGYYRNTARDKIVMDITKGKKNIVEKFLLEHSMDPDNFKYVEKTKKKRLLIAMGAKIADMATFTDDERAAVFNQHPDQLRAEDKIATVTCMGWGADNRRYILTSKHLFGPRDDDDDDDEESEDDDSAQEEGAEGQASHAENQPNGDETMVKTAHGGDDCDIETESEYEGRGEFISCFKNRMSLVSERYIGVHSFIESSDILQGEHINYQVDIAALPLTDDLENNLDPAHPHHPRRPRPLVPSLTRKLNAIYDKDYRTTEHELQHKRVVYKQGAVSGTTSGKIINTLYCDTEIFDAPTYCMMIRSEEPGQPFAGPGDSGALIWDDNGTPIALVSFADGEDEDDEESDEGAINQAEGDDERYTYAVRLDHCLRALRDKTGVAIVKCEAIGSPIVPVDPRPEPTLELRGNDSIEGLGGGMSPLEGAMAPAYLAAPAGPNQIVAMQPTPDPTRAAPAYAPQGAVAMEPNAATVDALVAQYRNRSLSSSSEDPETHIQTSSEEPEGMPRSFHGNT